VAQYTKSEYIVSTKRYILNSRVGGKTRKKWFIEICIGNLEIIPASFPINLNGYGEELIKWQYDIV